MCLAYYIAFVLTIAHIRTISRSGGLPMIIVTPIELSPEVYRHVLHEAEQHPNTTPDELIATYLTNFVLQNNRTNQQEGQ